MGDFTKIEGRSVSHPHSYFTEFIKDYLLFPVIAVIFGITTLITVFFIFPFWLFKEDTAKRK